VGIGSFQTAFLEALISAPVLAAMTTFALSRRGEASPLCQLPLRLLPDYRGAGTKDTKKIAKQLVTDVERIASHLSAVVRKMPPGQMREDALREIDLLLTRTRQLLEKIQS